MNLRKREDTTAPAAARWLALQFACCIGEETLTWLYMLGGWYNPRGFLEALATHPMGRRSRADLAVLNQPPAAVSMPTTDPHLDGPSARWWAAETVVIGVWDGPYDLSWLRGTSRLPRNWRIPLAALPDLPLLGKVAACPTCKEPLRLPVMRMRSSLRNLLIECRPSDETPADVIAAWNSMHRLDCTEIVRKVVTCPVCRRFIDVVLTRDDHCDLLEDGDTICFFDEHLITAGALYETIRHAPSCPFVPVGPGEDALPIDPHPSRV